MKRLLPLLFLTASMASALSLRDLDMNKVASGGMKLTKAVRGLSDAQEIKIGHEVGAYLAARYGLINDPAKLQYLHWVGLQVASHSSRKIPFHFGILKSDEINAFAAPGGYVFVTQGLLHFLQNEAELAGVLGHEISHIQERHIANAMRKADLLEAGQDFASASGAEGYATLTNFSIDFINRGFSRDEELEADRIGAVLAAETGYDAAAYRNSIDRLGTLKDVSRLTRFNRTHPPAAQRIEAINRVIRRDKLIFGQVLSARFQTALQSK